MSCSTNSSIEDPYDSDSDPEEGCDVSFLISPSDLKVQTYKVITSDEVVLQMNKEISIASDIMNVPPTITRIILDRHNWQTQSLMDKFLGFNDDDKELFFRDAHILNPRNYNNAKGHDTVAQCLICYDTTEITGLQCGHKFCHDCWSIYITSKIMDFGEQIIPCADSKCDIIIEDDTVKTLVNSDPNVLAKYNRLICNSFVKWMKNLFWCKSPGCNYVIDNFNSTSTFVTCKCGCEFCCECYEETHAPISCTLLKKWKCDDSATQSYIAINTKACPNCHVDIEKNGGCPHMLCQLCKYEFCWKCLKSWKAHNTCSTLEKDLALRKTRTLVDRLKYCWNRYSYNSQSLRDEIQRFDIVWEEYENRFELKNALDVIFQCRNFLMYSYAFVYYLKEHNEVYMFEDVLEDLEANVDKWSVRLEDYIRMKENNDDFANREEQVRFDIVQGVSHCDSIRERWLHRIEEGHDKLEENTPWKFREEI